MRFRDDTPRLKEQARAAVAAWRKANPEGTAAQMLADLGPQFHKDYGPVLRAYLFRYDKDARQPAGDPR